MKIIKEFGRNPNIDWLAIVIASILAALGLAFASYTLYNAVVNGQIKGTSKTPDPTFVQIDEKLIGGVFDRFDVRADATKKTLQSYVAPPDPSI